MVTPRIVGPSGEVEARSPFDGSIAVGIYDLLFLDGNDVKPASSQTDYLSETANQAAFARNFAGLSKDARKATDTDAVENFPYITHAIAEIDCVSATFERGDYVAAIEAASGTELENQKVVKTTNSLLAIGRVTKRYATATTRVQVEFIAAHLRQFMLDTTRGPLPNDAPNIETLAATKTLTVNDAMYQVLDPGGAGRTVILEAETLMAGKSILIHNAADAAEALTVQNDALATIGTVAQNESALFWCDGTTWRMLQGASV